MFAVNAMNDELKSAVSIDALFDFYRLVDNATHRVYDFPKGAEDVVATNETCHNVWGDKGPCANCTSRTCILRRETIIKIMHLQNQFLLIYSTPVTVKGREFALELIKDVTTSFMIPNPECNENIEVTHMIERFNELAIHDTFTGLYNKTFIMNEISELIDAGKRNGMIPALDFVMLDLDLFKNINDELGHTVGDDILLSYASMLKRLAERKDVAWAGRYGGDEFVLVALGGLNDEDRAAIDAEIEEFKQGVKSTIHGAPNISVSYGISTLQEGDTVRDLIDRADDAMYEMKEKHHKEMGAEAPVR